MINDKALPDTSKLCRAFIAGDTSLKVAKALHDSMPQSYKTTGTVLPIIQAFRWLAAEIDEMHNADTIIPGALPDDD